MGNEHQHLYAKILHLVMADGAYQEGKISSHSYVLNECAKTKQQSNGYKLMSLYQKHFDEICVGASYR